MTEGCNDKPNEKMNQGEPRYNEQSEGIMVCDGVSSYVCVAVMCMCVRVSSQDSTRAHTHALVIVITSLFLNFSDFLDFQDIPHRTCPRPRVLI